MAESDLVRAILEQENAATVLADRRSYLQAIRATIERSLEGTKPEQRRGRP